MFETKVVQLNEIYKKVFLCFLRKNNFLAGNIKIKFTGVYLYESIYQTFRRRFTNFKRLVDWHIPTDMLQKRLISLPNSFIPDNVFQAQDNFFYISISFNLFSIIDYSSQIICTSKDEFSGMASNGSIISRSSSASPL